MSHGAGWGEPESFMSWETILREVFKALARNRMRSLLTMVGIIMGVGSFICVVGVGRAGSSRVEDQLSKVGDNLIWVEAGSRAVNGVRVGSRGTKSLTAGDAQAVLDQVPGVKSASPNVDGHIQTVYGNLNWGTQYRGVSPEYFDIRKWDIGQGAAFTEDDQDHNAAVCVLGQTVAAIPLVFVTRKICGPAAVQGARHAALAGLAACAAATAAGVAVSLAVPLHHKLVAVALAVPAAGCAILAFGVVAYFLDDGDLKAVLAWVRRRVLGRS